MSDSNHTGAFVAGFVLGGLVGAVAALLMTPQSGEKTRLQIQERGIELKSQFGDFNFDARGQAEKLATQLQERGRVILEERRRGDSALDEVPSDEKETAETAVDEGDE
jgi:gas vesicle protein